MTYRSITLRHQAQSPSLCYPWTSPPLCHFTLQDNDLYQFQQSKFDLKSIQTPAVAKLRNSLYSPEFRQWIKDVTGGWVFRFSRSMKGDRGAPGCERGAACRCCICLGACAVAEQWPSANGAGGNLYTGVETNDTVDMSCALYGDGSHLLCHDDDLAERRIAYIIYFVSEARVPTHAVMFVEHVWCWGGGVQLPMFRTLRG